MAKKYPWKRSVDDGLDGTKAVITRSSDAVLSYGPVDDLDEGNPDSPEKIMTRYLARGKPDLSTEIVTVASERLRKKDKSFGGPDYWLNEDFIGGVIGVGTELWHPNISSCLGFVCLLKDRITGAHFTVGTTQAAADGLLDTLANDLNERRPILGMYAFGPSTRWVERKRWKDGPADWAQPGFMGAVAYCKERLGYSGKVWVAEQVGGTNGWYRSMLDRSASSKGVMISRATAVKGTVGRYEMLGYDVKPGPNSFVLA